MRTECGVHIYKSESEKKDYAAKIMEYQDDAFYIVSFNALAARYKEWTTNLPTITPFYAVKCNHSLMVVKALAAIGCSFDCASKSEISKVLSVGVSPDKIIYANPAKGLSHLKYAAKHGVRMMTYDSVFELDKIKEHFPKAKVVLRIRADAKDVSVSLGPKFGCNPQFGMELVQAALERNLELIGISFHVGTGCRELNAYARAIHIACKLIRECKEKNVNLSLLDIGGGFSGDDSTQFAQICKLINEALEEEKDTLTGMRIIAEPGRYFVYDALTLYTCINGLKNEEEEIQYYVNDGIYGAFNCVVTEDLLRIPTPFQAVRQGALKKSRVWGQTYKNLDLILKSCLLPEMKVGEWLEFSDMGAYSTPLSMTFHGFEIPKEHYVVSEETWSRISEFFYNLENEKSNV